MPYLLAQKPAILRQYIVRAEPGPPDSALGNDAGRRLKFILASPVHLSVWRAVPALSQSLSLPAGAPVPEPHRTIPSLSLPSAAARNRLRRSRHPRPSIPGAPAASRRQSAGSPFGVHWLRGLHFTRRGQLRRKRAARDAIADQGAPLDHGIERHARTVRAAAAKAGVSSRVIFVDQGHFPTLVCRAEGVISVNSTGGLAALDLGRPTIALGQAI